MSCKRFVGFADFANSGAADFVIATYARPVTSFTALPHFCRMKLVRERLATIRDVGAG